MRCCRSYTHPPTTPLDIRLGLTKEEGIHHKLRWGIVSASAIASDWIKSLQASSSSAAACPLGPARPRCIALASPC